MEALKKLLTVPILQNIKECKNVSEEIEKSKIRVQKIVGDVYNSPCLNNLYKLNDEYYNFYKLECNNYYSSKYLKVLYNTYQNALVYVLYQVMLKMNDSINNSTDKLKIFEYYNELIITSLYFIENYTKKDLEYISNNIIYNLELIKPKIKEWIKSMTLGVTILFIKKIIINLLTGYTGLIIKDKETNKGKNNLILKTRKIIHTFISSIFNNYIFNFIISFSEFSFFNVLFKKEEFSDVVANIVLHHVFVLKGKVYQENGVKDIILEYDNKNIENIVDLYIETRRLIFKYVCKVGYSCEILKSLPYMSNMKLTNTLDKSVMYPYNYPRYSVDYEILQGINYIFNALQYKYYCTIFSDNIDCYVRTFSEYKYGAEIHPWMDSKMNSKIDPDKIYNNLDDNVYLSSLLKYYPIYSEDREYLEKFKGLNVPTTSDQLSYDEIKDKINNNWSDFEPNFELSEWSEDYYTVLKANGQVYVEDEKIGNKIYYKEEEMPDECRFAEIYVYKKWSDDMLNNMSDPCIDYLYYENKDNENKALTAKLDSFSNNSDKIEFIKNKITVDNYSEYGLKLNTFNALQRYFSLFNRFICEDIDTYYGHLTKIQFKYWLKFFSNDLVLNNITMNCFNYITFNDNKQNYPALVLYIYQDFQSFSIYYICYSINCQKNFTSNLTINDCFKNTVNPQNI